MSDVARIAIVGSGPAGCIAAWACHLAGIDADVYTNTPNLSPLPGAQYLHSPFVLPGGVVIPHHVIRYAKFGTREQYSKKIYGEGFDPAHTSWDKFPAGEVHGWPLRRIYELLHNRLDHLFIEEEVDREMIKTMSYDYDLIFNSAPAQLFASHENGSVVAMTEKVWIFTRQMVPMDQAPEKGLIVYEGGDSVPFYRYSYLEGREAWEYPQTYDPGMEEAKLINKPLHINQPPLAANIIPIGRYGKWKKGELVDSVFHEVSAVVHGYISARTLSYDG
jgi:hypothetical protein